MSAEQIVHVVMYRDGKIGTLCDSGAWGTPALFTAVTEDATCPGCRRKLDGGRRDSCDLVGILDDQRAWSLATFGPGHRVPGIVQHIKKELWEVVDAHVEGDADAQLTEWIDVVILAFDGAWRAGYTSAEILEALNAKHAVNRGRTWPDWRESDGTTAIEHVREGS